MTSFQIRPNEESTIRHRTLSCTTVRCDSYVLDNYNNKTEAVIYLASRSRPYMLI